MKTTKQIIQIFITLGIFITGYSHGSEQVSLTKGLNTIKGSALLRQNGGGIVTCAGNEVKLIPATEYSEKVGITGKLSGINIYENIIFRDIIIPVLIDNYKDNSKIARNTFCNANGNFQFDNVKDGSFFITTDVIWRTGSVLPEGGTFLDTLKISGGETKTIILTDK